MDEIHFDTGIPLVSNINSIVAKTNSLHTALCTKRGQKDEIPYTAVQFCGKKLVILIQIFLLSLRRTRKGHTPTFVQGRALIDLTPPPPLGF